ncbi:unnamed protein product [Closterium sp. NIES-54]
MARHSTARHCTARHSTARHSTAQYHGTELHLTALPCTVLHCTGHTAAVCDSSPPLPFSNLFPSCILTSKPPCPPPPALPLPLPLPPPRVCELRCSGGSAGGDSGDGRVPGGGAPPQGLHQEGPAGFCARPRLRSLLTAALLLRLLCCPAPCGCCLSVVAAATVSASLLLHALALASPHGVSLF